MWLHGDANSSGAWCSACPSQCVENSSWKFRFEMQNLSDLSVKWREENRECSLQIRSVKSIKWAKLNCKNLSSSLYFARSFHGGIWFNQPWNRTCKVCKLKGACICKHYIVRCTNLSPCFLIVKIFKKELLLFIKRSSFKEHSILFAVWLLVGN